MPRHAIQGCIGLRHHRHVGLLPRTRVPIPQPEQAMHTETVIAPAKARADAPGQFRAPRPVMEIRMLVPELPEHFKVVSAGIRLCQALADRYPELTCATTRLGGACPPPSVSAGQDSTAAGKSGGACRRMAGLLNKSSADLVCLQYAPHVYGGAGMDHIACFVGELRKPLVTVINSVATDPTSAEQQVMKSLFGASSRLVAPSRACGQILRECYRVPLRKIDVIPQGIPELPVAGVSRWKVVAGLQELEVLVTCGHLEAHKGIEHVIRALPAVVSRHPRVLYVVVGSTEPLCRETFGEAYLQLLKDLTRQCGVENHVRFLNRFVDEDEMNAYLGAADICLSPYDMEERPYSANLARMVGTGCVVVSTPYMHARELLADGRGRLVRFASPGAISEAILELLADPDARSLIRQRAWEAGRQMIWPTVAQAYMQCFRTALESPRVTHSQSGEDEATASPGHAIPGTRPPPGAECCRSPEISRDWFSLQPPSRP